MRPGRSRAGRGYAGRRGGRGDGSPPGITDTKAGHGISSAGAALCRGIRVAHDEPSRVERARPQRLPEPSRLPPRFVAWVRGDPPNNRFELIAKTQRPTALQAFGKAEGSSVSRPKVGRQGRREIGRALETFYDDVVRQGVPSRILELLDDLDARAASHPNADRA